MTKEHRRVTKNKYETPSVSNFELHKKGWIILTPSDIGRITPKIAIGNEDKDILNVKYILFKAFNKQIQETLLFIKVAFIKVKQNKTFSTEKDAISYYV